MSRLVSPSLAYVASLVAGTAGTGRVVPSGAFRSDAYRGSAEAADSPLINKDRTFVLRPMGGLPWGNPTGYQFGSDIQATIRADLIVYYRLDVPFPEVSTDAGMDDTASTRVEAMDDMAVILRALVWAENQNHTVSGATVVKIEPAGEHRLDEVGEVLLSTQPLVITAQWSPIPTPDLGATS